MQRFSILTALALFSVLLAAGCASNAAKPAASKAEISQRFTEVEKSKMTEEEKLAIYNQYRDEDDRLICTRDVVTGSHFRRNNCRTVAQRRAERQEAQEALQRAQGATLLAPEGI